MEIINETTLPIEAVHPTELIIDELNDRGISRKEMAERLGMKPSNFSRMIKQKEAITSQMAQKLEEALGIPASMWLNLQISYDKDVLAIAQRNADDEKWAAEEKKLAGIINIAIFLKQLGIEGYAFAKDRIESIFNLLKVKSTEDLIFIAQPSGYFKKSEKISVDEKNLKTWILLAHASCIKKKVDNKFEKGCIEEIAIDIARQANNGSISEAYIEQILAKYGIGYCYVNKIEKAPVDAYSSIINNTPYIVVSHRHNNMDMLVFNVLHELHHIEKDLIDGSSNISNNTDLSVEKQEREINANKFAEDMLIPKVIWDRILKVKSRSVNPYNVYNAIVNEAIKNGISPSIASWRYKHQTNTYNIKGHQSPKIK